MQARRIAGRSEGVAYVARLVQKLLASCRSKVGRANPPVWQRRTIQHGRGHLVARELNRLITGQ